MFFEGEHYLFMLANPVLHTTVLVFYYPNQQTSPMGLTRISPSDYFFSPHQTTYS